MNERLCIFFFLFKMIYFSFVVMFLYVIHFFHARQYQNEKKTTYDHIQVKKKHHLFYMDINITQN